MQRKGEQQWISIADTATRYGVDYKTIRRLTNAGKFPAGRKFGRIVRYRLAELDKWDETGRVAPSVVNKGR